MFCAGSNLNIYIVQISPDHSALLTFPGVSVSESHIRIVISVYRQNQTTRSARSTVKTIKIRTLSPQKLSHQGGENSGNLIAKHHHPQTSGAKYKENLAAETDNYLLITGEWSQCRVRRWGPPADICSCSPMQISRYFPTDGRHHSQPTVYHWPWERWGWWGWSGSGRGPRCWWRLWRPPPGLSPAGEHFLQLTELGGKQIC